jgi:biopolymer transport protein ExbB
MQAYETLGIDAKDGLDALMDRDTAFKQSPSFRIYRQGINEMRRRKTADGKMQMNQRAMVAIRAALDAVMIREGQRLNAQMVLLTIAISGGPFIGLLGTVVGVMVTFARIAAAGDVNINAIAPGMAAALLATTAGLAVAIPSLFGYNYLGSKVKELSADMHVFADEFLARLNELYGD